MSKYVHGGDKCYAFIKHRDVLLERLLQHNFSILKTNAGTSDTFDTYCHAGKIFGAQVRNKSGVKPQLYKPKGASYLKTVEIGVIEDLFVRIPNEL